MAQITNQDFRNVFIYYQGEEHQVKAVDQLFAALPDDVLSVDADWIRTYRKQTTEIDK